MTKESSSPVAGVVESAPTAHLALAEPTEPKKMGWQFLYWLANVTVGLTNIAYNVGYILKVSSYRGDEESSALQ